MPFITFSRNSKIPRRKLLDTCTRLGKLFDHSVVVLRGCKSIASIASDASSKGFRSVIILQDGPPQKIEVLIPLGLGTGYAWGKEYVLKATKARLTIERGGKNAQKTLIDEASD